MCPVSVKVSQMSNNPKNEASTLVRSIEFGSGETFGSGKTERTLIARVFV